jgi:myo-inositol 2-dehydrogenase/D-chiro-inositol 1-dehydrogenase
LNRREFTLSAAGLVASAGLLGADNDLAAGMIGVGGRGTFLLQNIVNVPGVKVAAICDIDPTALDKGLSAAARDKPQGLSDYRKLLEKSGIQAVVIATPCYLHREMVIAALQAGKNVYCEKPLAITPEDLRAIVEAAKHSKGILQVGFQRRYSPQTQEMVQRVHAGSIGKPLFIRGQYYTTKDLPHNQAWKFDRDKYGDMLVEQAIHQFDLYNWILDSHPVRACGIGGANLLVNDPPGRTIMDHYSITYEYPNGVHVSFTHVYYAVGRLATVNDIVFGEKGAIAYDQAGIEFLDRETGATTAKLGVKGDYLASTLASLTAFVDNVRNHRHPVTDAELGRLAALTVIMGERAMLQGRTVEWKEVNI